MNENNRNLIEINLITLISQYNFTIPEIQREYVWGENEKVVTDFLNGIKNKIYLDETSVIFKFNVGFLYTYTPEGFKYIEGKHSEYNLIDGQQRFTTLFLLIFSLAIKEGKIEEFKNLTRVKENLKMCFNFKVRNLTQQFLLELIDKIDNLETLKLIEKQTWFLNDYKNDISIKAMLKTLFYVQKIFFEHDKFYNKVLDNIYFWHFKTEVTSQGEELYITMNARGQDLVNNEITKAYLFIDELDLKVIGKQWENWQHFFWKNRGLNINADIGFNGFLSWIDELIKIKKYEFSRIEKFQFIENCFNALVFIIKNYETEISHSNRTLNIKNLLKIDFNYIEFLSKPNIEKKQKLLLFSLLYYVINQKFNPDLLDFYRFIRILRNSINNINADLLNKNEVMLEYFNLAEVNTVFEINNITLKPFFEKILQEELYKIFLYKNTPYNFTIESLEGIFWLVEDHEANNGSISNLIQLTYWSEKDGEFNYNQDYLYLKIPITLQEINLFQKYYADFVKILPDNNKSYKLKGLLLLTNYYSFEIYSNNNGRIKTTNTNIVNENYFLRWVKQIDGKMLDDFFKEKEILNTNNLENTKDYKLQLFAHYVIKSKNNNWDWNKGLNFGIWGKNEDLFFKSFFDIKCQFQHYVNHWRANENDLISPITIEDILIN